MKLKIKDIADLKEGRKNLEQIQKDGKYPKYLHRQISNGIKEFQQNYEDYLKKETTQNYKFRERFAMMNNIQISMESENFEDEGYGRVASVDRYNPNDEYVNEMVGFFNKVQDFNNHMEWANRDLTQLSEQLDTILDWKSVSLEQKEELGSLLFNAYYQLHRSDTMALKKELVELNYKYFPNNDGRGLTRADTSADDYAQCLNNITKPYRKIMNNIKKVNDKYDFGLTLFD